MPGVPPDAVENVKKLFKGIFRRGRKAKEDKATESAATTQTTQQTTSTASQQKPAAAQQPPLTDGAPNTDKPLPPTHPLQTGPHDKPQVAVPQKDDAQPGPAIDGARETKNELAGTGVVPSSASVSAVEKDTPPAPPPKNDQPVAASPATTRQTSAKENTAPTTTTAQPAVTETTQPALTTTTGTTEEAERTGPPAASIATATTATTAPEAAKAEKPVGEKVPVQDEMKPAAKTLTGGGMSATSGPLEDYPDGVGLVEKE
ncbi:Hypothetical predicted protein [Lecanosticta acicola]|uniref:Uncharacterized protein n=1 Tax=Lecanosticta acicola TaxID=111012 RepID=A0AAI8Z4K0_9PEZI|nr:Hypothetical predicted protein [Lecanosticta acicola]